MIIPKKMFFLSKFEIKKSYKFNNNLKAILVPHAGLSYSGEIAQWAYNFINWNNYDKVILLSTHHSSGNYIPESDTFTLNNKVYKLNNLNLNINKSDDKFSNEHSWLVQMPFIDNTKPITMILVGDYNDNLLNQINQKLMIKQL